MEILISERYYKRAGKLFQHFIFNKREGKYLRDTRLFIGQEFERKIKSKILDLYFIQRRDEETRVVLEYENNSKEKPNNNYFVVMAEIPKTLGCDYCKYKKVYSPPFIWCKYKQKTLSHKIKTCKFFRQKNETNT